MTVKHYPTAAPLAGSVLLSCLLMSGCATEKALTEQTQPLQEQVVRLEQSVAASNEAAARAAREQAASLAAKQANLEREFAAMRAGVQSLQDKTKAQDERTLQTEQRLNELALVLADHGKVLADQTKTDKRLAELGAGVGETSRQMAALKAKQEADATALSGADATLDGRVSQAEQRLKALSVLVQEALAQASKEIFLANGKEAFTVMLTDDKVLYPQNDPSIDSRDAAKLDQLVERLAKLDQEYHLDIQGHTDDISSDDNNYNLGKARAEVVKRYLHEKKGISISRMSTISYGANKPLDVPGGRNRRIFIRVLVLK